MVFNPEDEQNMGPHCRNCHKGSSRCSACHNDVAQSGLGNIWSSIANIDKSAENWRTFFMSGIAYPGNPRNQTMFHMSQTSLGVANSNPLGSSLLVSTDTATGFGVIGVLDAADQTKLAQGFFKKSQTVNWGTNWRSSATDHGENGKASVTNSGGDCSDDGFSWPHRTLGWKMLKDDLFGLNFDGTAVAVNGTRTGGQVAHDLDSVCLDCHNPTIWRNGQTQSKDGHVDKPGTSYDDYNDELITRGLP